MRLPLLFCLSAQLVSAAIIVRIDGNFGPPLGTPTVFDNQDYSVQFTIADPASTWSSSVGPGSARVDYTTSAVMSVPGIGGSFFLGVPNTVEYIQSGGSWMNIFQFYGLPAGDFMLVTPLQTLSGLPLWNGLAPPLGTPEINEFNHEPVFALWRLQQIPVPGLPSIPLASYDAGIATITVQNVPEPSAMALLGGLCVVLVMRFRPSDRGRDAGAEQLDGAHQFRVR